MNRETTLRLLNRFVDYNHKNMDKPFSEQLNTGRYLCGTDAKMVVLIPETEENKIENDDHYKPPIINTILPEFEPFDLDFNYLKKLYDDIPVTEHFIMEECDSCDGAGEFYHYGNSYECKRCDGMGEIQTNMTHKVKNPQTAFKFDGVNISINHIEKIMEIYKAVGKTEFEFKMMKIKSAMIWLKLDDIIIGIVGIFEIENDKKKWDTISVELKNRKLASE